MKKIIFFLGAMVGWLSWAAISWAQDTTPRGPSEWTGRNWLGFCIQISIFILAIIGIYKLALGGSGEKGNIKSDTPGLNSTPQNPAADVGADKMNTR